MDELFQSELLKAILCGQFGDYGMTLGQHRAGWVGSPAQRQRVAPGGNRGICGCVTYALEPIINENWVVE